MTRCTSCTTVLLLLCSLSLPAWGQQYFLYEPKSVTAEEKIKSPDGVLVTEIPVQKGDTLYDISRKYSGRGMYYPQILLFNNIKDPNLIYTGDNLKIPLPQDSVSAHPLPVKKSAVKTKKHKSRNQKVVSQKPEKAVTVQDSVANTSRVRPDEAKRSKRVSNDGVVRKSAAREENEKTVISRKSETAPGAAGDAAKGRNLFDSALKSYRQNDFRVAIELFDKYLAENPDSPLAPDASLYQAECYLRLSSQ